MPIYDSAPYLQSDEDQQQDQPTRSRCRHIFAIGRRCGSPCLRNEHFCYYHHTTRRPVSSPRERRTRLDVFDLPNPEDRESARAAVTQIMHAIAHNNIDLKRAGMLLYSLQIALCTLPPHPRPAPLKTANHIPLKDIVDDLVYEEPHGYIAPEGDYEAPEELKPRLSLGRQLLEEFELYEARQAKEAAEQAAREAAEQAAPENAEQAAVETAQAATEAGAPTLDSETGKLAKEAGLPPLTSAQPAPPRPHRPAAIDLRAAAEPSSTCRKKCRPERSGSPSYRDPRSRRTCGSLTPPQPPEPLSNKASRLPPRLSARLKRAARKTPCRQPKLRDSSRSPRSGSE